MKTPKQLVTILERLADWLLGESVSFRKLDNFRVELGLDVSPFTRLLGISTQSYTKYNKTREVKLGKIRDKMHTNLSSYLLFSDGTQNTLNKVKFGSLQAGLDPTTAQPPKHPGDFWSFRPFVIPDYGKSLGIVKSATTPETITNRNSLHYWTPLDKRTLTNERNAAKAMIKLRHTPQPGDDYIKCECSVCGIALSGQ